MKYLSLVFLLAFSLFLSAPIMADSESPGSVNVNTADVETLTTLKGIGPSRAEAIIAYRETHGPFRSLHELVQVRGIGSQTIEENMDRIVFD